MAPGYHLPSFLEDGDASGDDEKLGLDPATPLGYESCTRQVFGGRPLTSTHSNLVKSPRHQPDPDSIAEEQQSPVASGAGEAGSLRGGTTISSGSAPVWTQQDHPHSWMARITRGDNVLVIARDIYSLLLALDPIAYSLPYRVCSQFALHVKVQ